MRYCPLNKAKKKRKLSDLKSHFSFSGKEEGRPEGRNCTFMTKVVFTDAILASGQCTEPLQAIINKNPGMREHFSSGKSQIITYNHPPFIVRFLKSLRSHFHLSFFFSCLFYQNNLTFLLCLFDFYISVH